MSAGGNTREYSAETVIRTQRRVLRMLARYIRQSLNADTIYTDGRGLMTGDELYQHASQAAKLKSRRVR